MSRTRCSAQRCIADAGPRFLLSFQPGPRISNASLRFATCCIASGERVPDCTRLTPRPPAATLLSWTTASPIRRAPTTRRRSFPCRAPARMASRSMTRNSSLRSQGAGRMRGIDGGRVILASKSRSNASILAPMETRLTSHSFNLAIKQISPNVPSGMRQISLARYSDTGLSSRVRLSGIRPISSTQRSATFLLSAVPLLDFVSICRGRRSENGSISQARLLDLIPTFPVQASEGVPISLMRYFCSVPICRSQPLTARSIFPGQSLVLLLIFLVLRFMGLFFS